MIRRVFSFLLLSLILLSVPVFAGDTYDQTVSVREDPYSLLAYGTIDFSTDSTGNFYTQCIYIADCHSVYNAIITAYDNAGGTCDVDVYAQYSFDRETWKLATINSGKVVDNLNGGTLQSDSLNVADTVPDPLYQGGIWVRLKFDGQATNMDEVDVYWFMTFTKPEVGRVLSKQSRIKNKI